MKFDMEFVKKHKIKFIFAAFVVVALVHQAITG
jgi:hypothetical protein